IITSSVDPYSRFLREARPAAGSRQPMRRPARGRLLPERRPTVVRSDRTARTEDASDRRTVAHAHGARGDVRNRAPTGGRFFFGCGKARTLMVERLGRYGSLRSAAGE